MNSSSSAGLYYSSLPYPPLHGCHEESEGAGQQDVIVILAFISGASFITLTILLILCAACRWRAVLEQDDNTSTQSIIYNIEQDKVSINPMVEKHMQVENTCIIIIFIYLPSIFSY